MNQFVSDSVRFVAAITLEGGVGDVFELFSPLGEKHWVPDWNPELLHPPGAAWEQGLVFRTKEEMGNAIWIVTRLDRIRHRVEYVRVEPEIRGPNPDPVRDCRRRNYRGFDQL